MKTIKTKVFGIPLKKRGIYYEGLILSRDITYKEAKQVYNLLGGNVDLLVSDWKWEDDKEFVKEQKETFRQDIQKFLEGECGYDYLSDNYMCGEGMEDLDMFVILGVIEYLKKKEVI